MMLRFATFVVVLFAVVLSLGAGEQAPADANRPTCEAGDADCFDLWLACRPFRYFVSVSGGVVTQERVENAVESRLRAARLYSSNSFNGGYLFVSIVMTPDGPVRATAIHLEFNKALFDRLTSRAGIAMSYDLLRVLRHGSSRADAVMESVAGLLDEFVNDYLRVNEPACAAGRGR